MNNSSKKERAAMENNLTAARLLKTLDGIPTFHSPSVSVDAEGGVNLESSLYLDHSEEPVLIKEWAETFDTIFEAVFDGQYFNRPETIKIINELKRIIEKIEECNDLNPE